MRGEPLSASDFVAPGEPCQICGATESEPYYSHNGMELVRCVGCGFIFLDPLPSPSLISKMYADPYDGATTSYFAKAKRKKKLWRCWKRAGLLAGRFGFRVSGRRFLDVGSSAGYMVEAARRWGFKAHGVELDSHSVAFARKHYPGGTYSDGTIEEFAASDAMEFPAFDVLHCSDVIEHIPHVNPFMVAVRSVLKPGGLLYLTTMDINHPRRPENLLEWDGFAPPAHCLYFSPATIQRLLENHGFCIVRHYRLTKPGIKLLARKL